MDDFVLSPVTRRQLEQFITSPRHAIQIVGPTGIGKLTVGKILATQVLGLSLEKLENYAYFLHVQPVKQTIAIETIRETQRFLQRKTTGNADFRRVILLEDAHTMTTEAQNAFLKSLEEPPTDTLIILTVSEPQHLLATITSRVQTLAVHLPPTSDLRATFGDQPGFEQAYRLSGGLPGLLAALLRDDQTHPLLAAVEQAKSLLQAPLFTRLANIDSLAAQRDEIPNLLLSVKRIAQTGLEQAAIRQAAQLPRWQCILEATLAAQRALGRNANLKLTLTQFMLAC